MEQTAILLGLTAAAAIGCLSTLAILRRERAEVGAGAHENQYAVSTEGMKRCPSCNTGNLVTDGTCSNCGRKLPG